jgi:hypothetical protein
MAGTLYSLVYTSFLSNLTDYSFTNLTQVELEVLMLGWLNEACVNFTECKQDLTDRDSSADKMTFNITLTPLEIKILGKLMVIEWLSPQIIDTKLITQALSSKDIKLTSQANHLEKLMLLEQKINKKIQKLLNKYTWGQSEDTDLTLL